MKEPAYFEHQAVIDAQSRTAFAWGIAKAVMPKDATEAFDAEIARLDPDLSPGKRAFLAIGTHIMALRFALKSAEEIAKASSIPIELLPDADTLFGAYLCKLHDEKAIDALVDETRE